MKVNWDDEIPNTWKIKKHIWNHQPNKWGSMATGPCSIATWFHQRVRVWTPKRAWFLQPASARPAQGYEDCTGCSLWTIATLTIVSDGVPYFAKLVDAWNKDKKWHESTIIYGKYHSMISILYNFGTYRLYLSLFPIASVVGRMGTLLQVCEPVCDVTENLWWG